MKIGITPTVLQAELYVIEICSRKMIGNLPIRAEIDIKIFTDLSNTAWSCHEALNTLGKTNSVTLMGIPSHSGFTGWWTCKTSVRRGLNWWSCSQWIISERCNEEHSGTPRMVNSKEFMKGPSKTRTDNFLQLSRQHLKAMTRPTYTGLAWQMMLNAAGAAALLLCCWPAIARSRFWRLDNKKSSGSWRSWEFWAMIEEIIMCEPQ